MIVMDSFFALFRLFGGGGGEEIFFSGLWLVGLWRWCQDVGLGIFGKDVEDRVGGAAMEFRVKRAMARCTGGFFLDVS
jgi:hypothetical protein